MIKTLKQKLLAEICKPLQFSVKRNNFGCLCKLRTFMLPCKHKTSSIFSTVTKITKLSIKVDRHTCTSTPCAKNLAKYLIINGRSVESVSLYLLNRTGPQCYWEILSFINFAALLLGLETFSDFKQLWIYGENILTEPWFLTSSSAFNLIKWCFQLIDVILWKYVLYPNDMPIWHYSQ